MVKTMKTKTRTRLSVDARREQLVQIAVELFSRRPYEEVAVEEIAQLAGVSEGLPYHYFPSKRELYREVIRALTAEAYEQTEPDPSLPPFERLQASLGAFVDHVEARSHAFRTVFRAKTGSDAEIRQLIEDVQSRQVRRILEALTGKPDPPALLRMAAFGWMSFNDRVCLEWLDSRDVSRDQLRDLMAYTLGGLVSAAMQADPSIEVIAPPPDEPT
jgi:AcrR family transcriptional regulator